MLQETGVVARPRTARIDQRRASAASQAKWIDAKGSSAPIDVRVQVNKARRHDQAADVPDLGARKSLADLSDASVPEANVRDNVDPLRRIDDSPSMKNQIKRHGVPPS